MVLLKLAFILNDFPYHGTRYSGQEADFCKRVKWVELRVEKAKCKKQTE